MRLLFVLPEYPPDFGGGIATYYGALLPALVRLGHDVDVLVGSSVTEGPRTYVHEGVRVRGLDAGAVVRRMPAYSRYAPLPEVQRSLAGARALWEQADGGAGYDAVEVVDWGLLFTPWVAETGPPVRVRMAGSNGQIAGYDNYAGTELVGEFSRMLEILLLRSAHAIHATSQANAAFWRATTGREVTYLPPPVPARACASAGPARPEGFVAARVQEWKGPQVLTEALRRLGADAPTVEWAGRTVAHPETGEPYDRVLRRTYPDVWGPRIHQLGRMPPEEVARRQATAAFVVVPSLWDVYNFSAAEAMLQQAVLICSDGAGGVDHVDDGRNGFSIPSGDAGALADAIRRALALAPTERAAMGAAARETVLRDTNPDRIAAATTEHYAALGASMPPVLPAWVHEAVSPGPLTDIDAFLSHLPLRTLVRHSVRRLQAKFHR